MDTGITCNDCSEPAQWDMGVKDRKLSVLCPKCGKESVVPDLSDAAMFHFYISNSIYGVGKITPW